MARGPARVYDPNRYHQRHTLVVPWTTFDSAGAMGYDLFHSPGTEWASNYVRHLVADAIYMYLRAKHTLWELSQGVAEAPDVRGRLAGR